MRIVCLDVGQRRIGVAVSDALSITAQGVETIFSRGEEQDAMRVKEICGVYLTDRVLVGLPLSLNGQEGPQAQRVRAFARRLTLLGLNVRFQDERLTTVSAQRMLIEADMRREKRKQVVDKVAACYILQSFLDAGGWPEEEDTIKEIKAPEKRGVFKVSDVKEFNMEQDEIVELIDEDGKEVQFEHLMTLEHQGKTYVCLAPVEPDEEIGDDELVILRIDTDEDGNDCYVTIEDDEELDDVFEKYLEIAEADED